MISKKKMGKNEHQTNQIECKINDINSYNDEQYINSSTFGKIISIIEDLKKVGPKGISEPLLLRYIESIQEFNALFNEGTSDPDHFLSLTDLENLVLRLNERNRNIANELALEKTKDLEEGALIAKKKRVPRKRGKAASLAQFSKIHHDSLWRIPIQQGCLAAFDCDGR
jgi:hypothetical protein